jgi:hypothetical protein
MRKFLFALAMLLCSLGSAWGYVSIGLQLNAYPTLMPVPGSPVMYAPGVGANYFYSDGQYWGFMNGGWYSSSWYDGPWSIVAGDYVPLYILNVPVRYYAFPPPYFRSWPLDRPPRWDVHWGHAWAARHDWNAGRSSGGWSRPSTVAHNMAPSSQAHGWAHSQPSFVHAPMPHSSWAQPITHPYAGSWGARPIAHTAPHYGGHGQVNQRPRQYR